MKRILSLGAGVQSSAVLLMSCVGELEKLDAAIFADTGWEPRAVYDHLEWLVAEAAKAGIPVHVVSDGNLRSDTLRLKTRTLIPLYVKQADGVIGTVWRKCTHDYKIVPVERMMKRVIGLKPGARLPTDPVAEHWFGISLDEAHRMRMSKSDWKIHHYPLVDHRLTRQHCLEWMEAHGYPEPPRSACIGCPYHGTVEWQRIKADPEEWADAVEVDESIRNHAGIKGEGYLHPSCVPLVDADLRSQDEKDGQLSLFGNECAGMCGV